MGNTQSAEEQPRRPPNRLSKPRTNNSTSTLLSPNPSLSSNLALRIAPPDLSMSTSKRPSVAPSPAVTPEEEVDMAPARPPTTRRRSLFRSKSPKSQPEEEAKEAPKREAPSEAENEPLHRYSRLNSAMSSEVLGDANYFRQESLSQRSTPGPTPPMRSQRRPSYVPYTQQSTRLSLVVEQNSPEPATDDKSKQLGQIEENSIQREGSMSKLPRSMSVDSHTAIPIRRRSLLTPGIATRSSCAENDLFRNSSFTQLQMPDTDYLELRSDAKSGSNRMPKRANTAPVGEDVRKWSKVPVRFEQSPLDQLAAREEYDLPRITTPSDLDYGHLGSYKLGSLRITNGTASPATEGGSRQSSGPGPSQPTSYSSAYFVPGEYELEQAAAELGDISWTDPERQYSDYTNPYTNEPEELSEQFAYVPIEPSRLCLPEGFDAPMFTNPRSPTRSFEMAQAYMNEIASSPFSFDDTPESPPILQATSKHTANEDHLFDDDAETPVHDSTFSDGKNKTSNSILSSMTNSSRPEQSSSSRTHSEDSGEPSAKAFKPLTKSDSGYSSNVSLKSIKMDIPKHDNTNQPPIDLPSPPTPAKDPPPTPPKALYSKNSYEFRQPNLQRMSSPVMQTPPMKFDAENDVREIYGLKVSKSILQRPPIPRATSAVYTRDLPDRPQRPFRAPPPVPVKDDGGPVLVPQETPLTPDKSPEQLWAAGALHPLSERLPKRAPLDSRQSMPVMRRSDWQPQHNPSDSESSIVSISRTRRLGKKRPSSTQTVTVQCFQEIDHSRIPQVSKDQSASLEARLMALPLLEHTYKTINRTNSKETLATILSQGTFEEQAAHEENFNRFEGPLPNVPDNHAIEQVVQKHRVEIGRAVPKAAKGRKSREASFSRSRSRESVTTEEPAISSKPATGRKSYDFSIGGHSRRPSVEVPRRDVSPDDGIQDEFESQITSFDGISASLGGSAYQVAVDAILPRPRSNSITATSGAAPRMTDSRGRTKGMGSEAAAKLARDRSERRRFLSKDESYGNKPGFDDRGGSPGRMVFPNYEEMPPVPALPETVPVRLQQTRHESMQKKTKSSPPVTMTTRRKLLIPAANRNTPILSVDTTSNQGAPTRPTLATIESEPTPTSAPTLVAAKDVSEQTAENTKVDPWQAQRKMWADRRQSATQTLTKASQENLKAALDDPWTLQKTPSNEQQPSWHTLPSQIRHSEQRVGEHSISSLPPSPKMEKQPSQAHLQRKEELFLPLFVKNSFEKLSSKKVQRKSLPPNARTYSLTSQTSQTSQAPSIQPYPVQQPRLPIHPDQESDPVVDYTIYDENDGGTLTRTNSNALPEKQSPYQNDLSAMRDNLSVNLIPYGKQRVMNKASYDSLDSLSYHGAHPRSPISQTAPGSVRTSFDAASTNGKRATSMYGSSGGTSYLTPVSINSIAPDENSLRKPRVVSEGANYAKPTHQNANYVKPAYQQARFGEVRVPASKNVRPAVRPWHPTSSPAVSMSSSAPATVSPLSNKQLFNRVNVPNRYGGGIPFGELNNMESGRMGGGRRISSGGSYMNGSGGRSISPDMDGVDMSDVPVLVRSGNGLRV